MRRKITLLITLFCAGLLSFGQETAPYTQSFDVIGISSIPANWTSNFATGGSGGPWEFDPYGAGQFNIVNCPLPPDYNGTGGSYAWMDHSGADNAVALVSPVIDVSGLTTPRLIFQYVMCGVGYAPINDTDVEAWNGTGWTNIASLTTGTSLWEEFAYNLTPFTYGGVANDSLVQIRFVANSGGATDDFEGDPGIDDFLVIETPSCQYPGSLSASGFTPTTADLAWVEGDTATTWLVEIGPNGFLPGTGDSIVTTMNPYTATGLTGNTVYDFYVSALCDAGDTSLQRGPASFATSCVPETAPYTQNWDFEVEPAVNQCWTVWDVATSPNAYIRSENDLFPGAISNPNRIEFNNNNLSTTDTLAIVSPQFTDMGTDKRIRFFLHDESNTSDFIVGTVSDPADSSTFTDFMVITEAMMADDVWEEWTISFATYTGTDQYIAFRHGSNTTFDVLHIDDFVYETIPTCDLPTDLTYGNATDTSADLTWTDVTPAIGYEIEYGPVGFVQGLGAGTIVSATTNPLTISGLTESTDYDYYVRAICAVGDTSSWSNVGSFSTSCQSFTAPYFQNFDGTTEPVVDICWTVWDVPGFTNDFIRTENDNFPGAISSPNRIEFNNGSSGAGDSLVFVSPRFSDMDNTKRIRFYLHEEDAGSDLIIGTVSDPADLSSFTAYQTITTADMTDDVWEEWTVAFDTYTGTDKYIAFRHSGTTTFDDIFLDDFRYENIPTCDLPIDLVHASVTDVAAVVAWTEVLSATQWQISYGPPGFDPDTGTIVLTSANPSFLTGLTSNTDYEFVVRSVCSVSDTSGWSNPDFFKTLCDAETAPYYQNWDTAGAIGTANVDDCWRTILEMGNTGTAPLITIQSTFPDPFTAPNYVEIDNNSATSGEVILASPLFSDLSNDKRVRFFAYDESGNSDLIIGIMTDPEDAFTFQPVDTLSPPEFVLDQWVEYTVEFTDWTFGPGHVAFRHELGTTFDLIYVDDFRYEKIPTCAIPSFLVAQQTINDSTNLAWTENGLATEWQIEYGPAGFVQGTGDTLTTAVVPAPVGGLTANTDYDFYVRALCALMDTSPWSNVGSFTTQCDPFTAPYAQSWDGTTAPAIDECWTPLREFNNTTGELIRTYVGNFPVPNTGVNSIEMGNSSGTPATGGLVFVSPRFSDMGPDKRVRFFYYDEDNFSDMYVGTMSDANDYTSFTPYDTLLLADYPASWTEVTINFDDYTGTDQYIAFSHSATTTFDEMYIDDFNYEFIPLCQNPLAPGANGFTNTTAELFWTEGDTVQMEWEIEWDSTGFVQGTGNLDTTTSNPYSLTGLFANTTYDYYVRALCDPTTISPWTNVTTFTTLCDPFTAPYTQEWDATTVPAYDECWSEIITYGVTGATIRTETNPAPLSPNNSVEIHNGNNLASGVGELILVSPQFSDMGPDKRVRFSLYDDFNTSDVIVGTLTDVADPTTFHVIDTITAADMPNDTWQEYIIAFDNLSAAAAGDQFFGFKHGANNTFDRINIDNFEYEFIPFCPDPSFLSVDFVGDKSATLSWTPSGANIVDFAWEIQPADSALGNVSSIVASGTALTASVATGPVLVEQTSYDFYVQINCGSDSSVWVGPLSFTTICSPIPGPYCETFDNTSIPTCWTDEGGDPWRFSTSPAGNHIGNNGVFTNTSGSGGGFAWIDDSQGQIAVGQTLTSPLVDITGLNSPSIDFWFVSHLENQNSPSTVAVEFWDGASWTQIFENDSNSLNEEWEFVSIPVGSFTITGPVQVRIIFDEHPTNFYDDVAFDDVCINGFYLYDATVNSVSSPESGCGDEFTQIEVIIENLGVEDLTNVPVLVEWSNIATGDYTVVIPFLAAGASDTVLVDSVNTLAGGTLDVLAYTGHALDEVIANDSLTYSADFETVPDALSIMDMEICSGESVTVNATDTNFTARWYLAANDSVIFTGDTLDLAPTVTTDYYVEVLGSMSENVGATSVPVNGFLTSPAEYGLQFDANETFVLNEVTMYPSGTGTIEVIIMDDATEAILMTTGSIPITDGGVAFSAVQVPLGFTIPASTNRYRIALVNQTGIASMGREFLTAAVFPFVSPSGAVSIPAGSTGTPGGTSTSYYYFYNWSISIDGCPSEQNAFTLTVNEATFDTVTAAACDMYTLEGGTVVTMSGVYTDTLTGTNGCARYATQDVTINNSSTVTDTTGICNGGSVTLSDGTVITTAGTYTSTVQDLNGCDVTTTTTVEVGATFSEVQNVQICEGDTLTVGTSDYTATGTYVDMFTTAGGCDSTVTSNLVVNPLANVSIAGITTVCENFGVITLALDPIGGTLSGPGVTGLDFDPAAAGVGVHTLSYTFIGSNGCSASASLDVEVVVCTGIDDIEGIETVSVYPNPFAESINVLFEDASSSELTITLYDVSGRVMISETVATSKGSNIVNLDASSVDASGVYIIELERDGATHQSRLMKVK